MKRKHHMMQLVRERKVCFALLVEETTFFLRFLIVCSKAE